MLICTKIWCSEVSSFRQQCAFSNSFGVIIPTIKPKELCSCSILINSSICNQNDGNLIFRDETRLVVGLKA